MTVRDWLDPNRIMRPEVLELKKLSDRLLGDDRVLLLKTCDLIEHLRWTHGQLRGFAESVTTLATDREPHKRDYSLDDDPELHYDRDHANWRWSQKAKKLLKDTVVP